MLSAVLAAFMATSALPMSALAAEEIAVNDSVVATTAEAEETVYATMNVPYAAFYKSIGVDTEQVDVISTATTSKYKGTTGLATATYNDGTNISGVVMPVKLTAEQYAKYSAQTAGTDYYCTAYEGTPSAYLEMKNDGSFTYVGEQKDATGVTMELETNTRYGNYQLDFSGVTFESVTDVGKYIVINGEKSFIDGAYVTTTDGKSYAMYMLENIWLGRVFELAWSVQGADPVYKAHGSSDQAFHQYDMNGKTIKSVTLITDIGTYTIDANNALPKQYTTDKISVADAKVSAGSTKIAGVKTIPSDMSAQYTFKNSAGEEVSGFKVSGSKISYSKKTTKNDYYTVTISDSKGVYDSYEYSFNLIADSIPVKYNEATATLEGKDADATAAYLAAISGYTIGEKSFAKNGNLIDATTGKLDVNAAAKGRGTTYAFTESGSWQVTVSANGYADLTFIVNVKSTQGTDADGKTTYTNELVNVPTSKVSKLTAGSKKMTVKLAKVADVTYEISYSTSKAKAVAGSDKVVKSTKTSKTIKKLKKGKKYYVAVRTSQTVDGVTYTSNWSSAKSVKVK